MDDLLLQRTPIFSTQKRLHSAITTANSKQSQLFEKSRKVYAELYKYQSMTQDEAKNHDLSIKLNEQQQSLDKLRDTEKKLAQLEQELVNTINQIEDLDKQGI